MEVASTHSQSHPSASQESAQLPLVPCCGSHWYVRPFHDAGLDYAPSMAELCRVVYTEVRILGSVLHSAVREISMPMECVSYHAGEIAFRLWASATWWHPSLSIDIVELWMVVSAYFQWIVGYLLSAHWCMATRLHHISLC